MNTRVAIGTTFHCSVTQPEVRCVELLPGQMLRPVGFEQCRFDEPLHQQLHKPRWKNCQIGQLFNSDGVVPAGTRCLSWCVHRHLHRLSTEAVPLLTRCQTHHDFDRQHKLNRKTYASMLTYLGFGRVWGMFCAGHCGVAVWNDCDGVLWVLWVVRKIDKTYCDPLDIIWIDAAMRMGMRVQRSSDVNASWDGCGILTIGTPETLDPDDCVAQMILHEVCHALCEGPECVSKPDWGLDNSDPAKRIHEHACLRLQAALADQVQMRSFFAATTFFRSYYDRLPDDPLADGLDPAIAVAKVAWVRAQRGPWAEPLHDALRRSAMIARALQGLTISESIWHHQAMG